MSIQLKFDEDFSGGIKRLMQLNNKSFEKTRPGLKRVCNRRHTGLEKLSAEKSNEKFHERR